MNGHQPHDVACPPHPAERTLRAGPDFPIGSDSAENRTGRRCCAAWNVAATSRNFCTLAYRCSPPGTASRLSAYPRCAPASGIEADPTVGRQGSRTSRSSTNCRKRRQSVFIRCRNARDGRQARGYWPSNAREPMIRRPRRAARIRLPVAPSSPNPRKPIQRIVAHAHQWRAQHDRYREIV